MVHVKIEFWMWLSKELGQEFESPSDMRSNLQTDVEDGTTVRKLFQDLAGRYRAIKAKVFNYQRFSSSVALMLNGRIVSTKRFSDRVLEDGDTITVLPIYFGG